MMSFLTYITWFFYELWTFAYFDRLCKLEKRGMKFKKKNLVILDTGRRWRTQIWKGTTQRSFQQSLVEIGSVVSEEKIFFKFHSPFFYCPNLNCISIMMSFLTYITRFCMNFELLPIWPIMQIKKGGMKFKKNLLLWNYRAGTTQGSFQQSLVEIGSVVSEEKIFLKFHPPFFLICIIGQNRQKFKVHKKSRNRSLGGPLSNCVRQHRLVSKMAAITKNRNFFKWPKTALF
jgi:hypothetical protein